MTKNFSTIHQICNINSYLKIPRDGDIDSLIVLRELSILFIRRVVNRPFPANKPRMVVTTYDFGWCPYCS